MTIRIRVFAACLLGGCLAGVGQEKTPPAVPHPSVDGKIHLDVVVTAKNGSPVAGLTQGDFVLRDNKVARPISSFRAIEAGQEPVEAVLLVDAVNTGYQTLAYERGQIGAFLKADGGKLAVPTALAIFTDTGTQIQQGYSTDGNQLKASLDQAPIGLRSIRRSAGFYGAEERLQLSLKTLDDLISREAGRPGRKMIVWVSPGWPLFSGPGVSLDRKQQERIFGNVVNLSTRLREARITLYAINPLGADQGIERMFFYRAFLKGVERASNAEGGDLSLQVLAGQSGGLILNASNDVKGLLQQSFADAHAFYEVSFDAAPGDHRDEYHHIEVQVEKPGLSARTRDGYYAHLEP